MREAKSRARADQLAMVAVKAAEDAVTEADLADPNPDVEELFGHYDSLYFQGALAADGFTVKWTSSLQSSSFGSCTFAKPTNTITLSEPVLKYRSSTDLKKALLHEMIHAIIYVKHHRKDRNNHGPVFRAWMDAINSCSLNDPHKPVTGYNITTRHDFKPEKPFSFKGVLWKCDCGDTLPRASNQGPPSDACCIENAHDATCGNILCHWHNHKGVCGGSYESMGWQSITLVEKKVQKGPQLLLTYPSDTSKSKGTIQESSSAELQEYTKVTKPIPEDEHVSLSSLVKTVKRRRSQFFQNATVLAVEPPKEVKSKQTLVALEKHGLFSPAGYNDARSMGICNSKEAGKQHKPEDVQKLNVPRERHSNGKSLESNSLQKTGKRHRSEVVERVSILPDEPPKELDQKQALVETEEHELLSPRGCNDATSSGNGTLKKANKQHKPEDVRKPSTLPAVRQEEKLKLNKNLVRTQRENLSCLQDCIDAKTQGSIDAKKTIKQHEPDGAQRPSVLPAISQGKPTLEQEFVPTEMHKLFTPEACNYAKSPGSNSSKQADQEHKPISTQKACSQHPYPLRRLKRGSVAPEKNEVFHVIGCGNEKLLDKSSSKEARKHREPEDNQKTTVVPAVRGCKLKGSSFLASQKQQRKCRRQTAKKQECAVMSAWMNIYESDTSSGSTEPLVNKRTVRRTRERDRLLLLTYSRSKKANSQPLDNNCRIGISLTGHKYIKVESAQQSQAPSPYRSAMVPIKVEQVVTEATGGHSQTSALYLGIGPVKPADAPPDSVPSDSALIDISDDD